MRLVCWLNENSGAVTAIVTAVYAVFTIFLWWATKTQAAITSRMFEASNRPYLGIDHQSNTQGRSVTFTYFLSNRGAVPAVVASWQVRATQGARTLVDIERRGGEVVLTVFPSTNHNMGSLEFSLDGVIGGSPVRVEARVRYEGIAKSTYNTRRVDEFDAKREALLWRCVEIEIDP